MNYTLQQLRIFKTIAETKSITKASEVLHLTQPAVSIQLKKLQEQFDIPLTEVIGRQLYITEFGQEIAQVSERILNEVQTIRYRSRAHKGQLVGTLKISIVSTAKYVMPYFLSGFMRDHEGVDLQMDVINKAGVIRSLEENAVDFALVSVLPEQFDIDMVTLMKNKLYLVGSKAPFEKGKAIRKSDFSKLPFIFREKGSATRRAMVDFLQANGIRTGKMMQLTSNEAVKQAVIAGLGYSIMPIIGLKNELNMGSLQILPVKGLPISTTWNLIWLRSKKFSPIAEAYLEYVRAEKDAIIQEKFKWYEGY
ncbi:LysR family transcriptional regulator [Muriicola marianensis]|uniref:Transcriptional regulator n=1 Tax=Muriicola marianensis TaxID=1324801 RepID=A0ABQ1R0T0_9FLAO|nr:LysR family transcriptional regulator [Muriicola marianensis]GGD52400.1 transcriptional regulator [Muriicola marianensis]